MRALGLSLVLLLVAGCTPAGVIFPPLAKPILWPTPPEKPRVKYVGQLLTEADLKPAVGFGQKLGETLFGAKSVRSMLTPFALCTDGKDRLFVADSNAQMVHVFDLHTRGFEQWKPAKGFSQPVGIAYDPASRNLFVADSVAECIFVFDTKGQPINTIGGGILQRPCGMAWDAAGARLFVADAKLHQVIVLSRSGTEIARMGKRGNELGEFNFPTNVAIGPGGEVYVSDSLNFRIQLFGANLSPIRQIGKKGDLPGYFSQPRGIAVDSQGHLYIVDANFETVQIFNSEGKLLMDFGQEGRAAGEFWLPAGIFIDPANRIWIADSYNRRVQAFDFLSEGKP